MQPLDLTKGAHRTFNANHRRKVSSKVPVNCPGKSQSRNTLPRGSPTNGATVVMRTKCAPSRADHRLLAIMRRSAP
jgi:hypothetical protein